MAHDPVFIISEGRSRSLFLLKLILKSVFHSKFFVLILMVLMLISVPVLTISPTLSQRSSNPTDKGCATCSKRFLVIFLYISKARFTLPLKRPKSKPAFAWYLLSHVRSGLGNCSGVAPTCELYWLFNEYNPR